MTEASAEDITTLKPMQTPLLLRLGHGSPPTHDELGDDENDHIKAANTRAFRELEVVDSEGDPKENYTLASMDAGITKNHMYLGKGGVANVSGGRSEVTAALDIGNLHTAGHLYQAGFDKSKKNVAPLLEEVTTMNKNQTEFSFGYLKNTRQSQKSAEVQHSDR